MPPNQLQQHDQLPPPTMQDIDEKILQENLQIKAAQRTSYVSHLSPAGRLGLLALEHRFASLMILIFVFVGIPVSFHLVSSHHKNSGGQQVASNNNGTDVIDYPTSGADQQTSAIAGSQDNSGSADIGSSSGTASPVTPQSVKLSFSSTMVTASWQQATNATQYTVEIARDIGFSSPRSITSGTNSLVITGLSSDTTYYVRIKAVGASSTSGWSQIATGRTTSLPSGVASEPYPAQVTSVALKVNSTQSVTISWAKASHAVRYSVTRARNSSFTSDKKEYASVTSTSYTVSDLVPGTVYYFVVQASNDRGSGAKSSPKTAKTHMLIPSISSISVLSSTSLKPAWLRVSGATKYTIQSGTNSTLSGAGSITTANASVSFALLKPGTYYYFRVRATDGSYTTAWSKVVKARTAVAVPTGLKVSTVTYNSAKLNWSGSTGASGYTVRYATSSSMSSSTSKSVSGTSLSIGLGPNTKYYVEVSARDGTKSTAWSSQAVFTTKDDKYGFQIVSYNTHYSTSTSNNISDVRTLINTQGADILALQEENSGTSRSALRSNFVSCSSCHYGIYAPNDGGVYSAQNPIMWDKHKFALLASGAIKASDKTQTEKGTLRALYVNYVKLKVRYNGKVIFVLNNHLPSSLDNNGTPDWSQSIRINLYKKNIAAIKNKITNARSSGVVYTAGDFNVDYRADAKVRNSMFPYSALGGVGTKASYRILNATSGRTIIASYRLIDYVFLTNNSKAAVTGQKIITSSMHSDHYPLLVNSWVRP